ncbi:MAG: trypsin-like serine protease [Planctomycetota bacterium]|nr:trypsin-like serine protease [Planctomycetota bacterium]MDA1165973.1 trypsin-like serine protease [Planctomycetota bacterium]
MNITTWKRLLGRTLQQSGKRRRAQVAVMSESLEQRVYLSAAATLVNNELQVLSDADESIVIRSSQNGTGAVEVLIDGQLRSGFEHVTPAQINSIRVIGGAGANLIDLSAVTSQDFSFIDPVTGQSMAIFVEAGDGDDTILGSFDLNDSLFGGDGDDVINVAAVAAPTNPVNVGLNSAPGIAFSSGGASQPLRIINGTATQLFESVGIVGDASGSNGTGTLIAPQYVLTSAQNVDGLAATGARFSVGMQTYSSVAISIHPNYDPLQLGTNAANDIAIVRLDRDVTGVAPSPLFRNAPVVNDQLTIVGFGAGGDGMTGEDGTFGTKRSGITAVDTVTTGLIQWSFDDDTESNIAPGDIGGPNFVQVGTELFLAGVSSFNSQPNAAIGDVASATRVDAYANWIDFVVGTFGVSNRRGNQTIEGGDGNDALNGADGNDTIRGGDGNDTVLAGGGDDVISGGDGDDTLDGQDGADVINGDDGQDSILAGAGNDTANGGVGNDTVFGEDGNDSLFGGGDDDIISGDGGRVSQPGDDTIFGNSGDDVLVGGGGNDVIDGGAGNDRLDTGDQLLTISDTTVNSEGSLGLDGLAVFTVTLSRPSALTVTVDVSTVNGTATAGLDYQALTTTLTFAPGVLTQTFTVQTLADTVAEVSESFFAVLTNAVNAVVADSVGSAMIFDDGDGVQQIVFLDFDSQTDFVLDHFYTQSERDGIQARLEEIYRPFRVQFSQARPFFGAFSTIFVNQPPPGGLADEVDFRNLNPGLNASVDINGFLGMPGEPPATSQNFTELTAKVIAHELGHLMGLRHGDAIDNQYFGARSAVKLAFATFQGQVLQEQFGTHGAVNTAQPVTLASLPVPNTELTGSLAGLEFDVEATVVTGALAVAGEVDVYAFNATAGEVLNIEVLSSILAASPAPRIFNSFDTMVTVTDATGTAIPYYTGTATNDDEFESTDSILIDLIIPVDGTYYIQVESFSGMDNGQYELFVYNFAANAPALPPGTAGPVIQSAGSVTLIGGDGDDTLGGTTNADVLIGNGGDDVIVAFGGDDEIYAGSGRDQVQGGDGNDRIFGQGGVDTIEGGLGDDLIDGGTSTDFIYGDDVDGLLSGNDTISGSADDDVIDGGLGNDLIYGGSGKDTIFGGDGMDTIFGQGGDDVIDGGAGDDSFIWKQDGSDSITGSDGRDQVEIRGTGLPDEFTISQSGSTLIVTWGSEMLSLPNPYNNFVNGMEELVINAGNGDDLITVTDVNDVGAILIRANGQNDNDTISAAGALLGLVRLEINGGNGNDTLTGSDSDDTLLGSAGDDSINGGDGADILIGGDGQDALNGDGGDDLLQGNAGNDSLQGGEGDDVLEGSDGSDSLCGADGDDSLTGGFGDDILDGNSGDDILLGEEGQDILLGGSGDDTLDGGRNADTLRGHSGNDKIRGDHGNDLIFGGTGDDTIDAGDGEDTIDGDSGDDGIVAGNGNDLVNGGFGNDTVLGGDGDDAIVGGNGSDTLLGQDGDDGITGNGGIDTMDGGEGVNTLLDADPLIDVLFTPGMPFEITSDILSNLDASN